MSYLLLGFSLLIVFLLIVSRGIFYKYYGKINFNIKKQLDKMLKLIYFAPVIVLSIILILIFTYFKSKGYIRLSHAWLVISFWISSVIFYYISIVIAKLRKLIILLPAVGMVLSACIAIFLTPLPRYEGVFHNTNLIIPNLFGLIMLTVSYYTNYTLLTKET
jgi:hypothetical protein